MTAAAFHGGFQILCPPHRTSPALQIQWGEGCLILLSPLTGRGQRRVISDINSVICYETLRANSTSGSNPMTEGMPCYR